MIHERVFVLIHTGLPELVLGEIKGQQWLGLLSHEAPEEHVWIYVPFRGVAHTKGSDVRDLFTQPGVRLMRTDPSGAVLGSVDTIDSSSIPDGWLPRANWKTPSWVEFPE